MKAIERLYRYLASKGVKPTSFEAGAGFSKGYLSIQKRRGAGMGESALNKITDYCPDLSPEWLLTGHGDMLRQRDADKDLPAPQACAPQSPEISTLVFPLRTDRLIHRQNIPIYDMEATAGLVPLFTGDFSQQAIDQLEASSLPKCDGGLRVVGDSMYPILKSGDIVLYKKINDIPNSLFWGEMYLVSFEVDGDEHITVKYIQKSEHPGCIVLASQNPHHQPLEIEMNRIRALAFVKASIRVHAMQ